MKYFVKKGEVCDQIKGKEKGKGRGRGILISPFPFTYYCCEIYFVKKVKFATKLTVLMLVVAAGFVIRDRMKKKPPKTPNPQPLQHTTCRFIGYCNEALGGEGGGEVLLYWVR